MGEGVDCPRQQSGGGSKNGGNNVKNAGDNGAFGYLMTFGGGKIAVCPRRR